MLTLRALTAAVLVSTCVLAARGAAADPVQVLASDASGVTLRLDVPAPGPATPAPDGRTRIEAQGLGLANVEGRPVLPFAGALVALPPGARVSASVVALGEAEVRDGVDLELGPRPVARLDEATNERQPGWEPSPPWSGGLWPPAAVEVGAPFELRGQRLVRVTLYPWTYDSRTRRLTAHRSLTVRVAFEGGARGTLAARPPREDRAADGLFEGTVANYAEARGWRAAPAPLAERAPRFAAVPGGGPATFAFDENEPEVRVLLDSTGVWQLDFAALAAAGYPAAVPVAEVSVHRHEFQQGQVVPYSTIELPVEVVDANGNGTFDAGDRVLVWTLAWAERANASVPQRLWGEGEVVYVTRVRSPQTGLRLAPRSGHRGAVGLVPLASYPHTQEWERNLQFFIAGSAPADTMQDPWHWTTLSAYYQRDESVTFETNDLDTTHTARVDLTWQGRANETHWNWAQVRNGAGVYTTVVDSIGWFGRTKLTAGSTVFGSSLSEGATNRFRLWGKTSSGPPDPTTNSRSLAGLNYFVITYWRAFRPLAGYLACNGADAAGEYEILARGFTDSAAIRVWDVTDPLNPMRLTGAPIERNGATWDVRLQDSTATGARRSYVVFDTPKVPAAGKITPVIRRGLEQNVAGDYLLIVPEAFLGAVDPLVQLRQSQGLSVVVAPLEAVNDEFNGGRRSPYAIKRFIRYGFNRWNTQYVLLVGDGSEDPLHYDATSGTDWIPIQRIFGPVVATDVTGSFYESAPSDPWYGWCLNCPDPSLSERVPEVFVGRLPVNSFAEAQAVVAKLVAYETPQADESWRRQMTLVADDSYSGETTFGGGGGSTSTYCRKPYEDVFRDINEVVREVIVHPDSSGLAGCDPELFNESYYLPTLPSDIVGCTQIDTCRCNRGDFETRAHAVVTPELMRRLNAGRLWFNYQGHANERVMAHESFWVNRASQDDRDLLLNDGRLFLFTAFSCHPNAFAHVGELGPRWGTPSIGEDMLTLPNRGAIASWASVSYELLPFQGAASYHLNVHFARALFGSPRFDPWGRNRGRGVLGDAIATALLNNVRHNPPPGSFEQYVGVTYTLLGDPATVVSIGPPQVLVTANTQPVTSGQPVRLRIGGDTLVVDGDLVSNARIDSIAVIRSGPGPGSVILPPSDYTIAPAFPDTGTASQRGRRYHLTLGDSLRADSYRYTLRTVDVTGRLNPFDIVLAFETVLFADGNAVNDLDAIGPAAVCSLRVLSPKPLDPATDLTLRIGGTLQPFTFAAAGGDTSKREWILAWDHAPYPFGETSVELTAEGGAVRLHRFRVNVLGAELRLQNPLAFPNPFEDDLGTFFSFTIESATPADVLIRVFTVSGRLIYERREPGLVPGYHQLAWDGRDAEGDKLANGIYFYRMLAKNGAASQMFEGKLVKLRKPRRVEEPATP